MTGNHIAKFREAIRSAGMTPPDEIHDDGQLHRFPSTGKRGDDAGWYVLHGNGIPAGAFGDWRTGGSETWRADIGRPLTPAEQAQHRARMDEARRSREQEQERRHEEARKVAEATWRAATPASSDHPYLLAKAIQPHGVRVHEGLLLVLMRDAAGVVHSLQAIPPDGEQKRYTTGARVKGCYFGIGRPDGVLLICEGFATGASLHEATGHAVAVAFSAGNLEPVARCLREKYPSLPLVLCADDDYRTAGNPGITKATAAAQAVGGSLAVPAFGLDRPEDATDFNDLTRLQGAEAVRHCVASATAVEALVAPAPVVSPRDGTALILLNGSDIRPEPVRWLWDGWLAAGKLHILAGAPGTGKTTIAMALAATVSLGGRWPDGTRSEAGGVVVTSYEDGPSDTIAPRLLAAGADMARVTLLDGVFEGTERRAFSARDDGALLAGAIRRMGVRLLIVDPIISALGSFDSHKNAETRQALQPLADLAAETGVAILGIAHFTKGTAGRDPLERVSGSLAFGAVARVVMGAATKREQDGEEQRLFVRVKSNIGPDSGGFTYDLEQMQAAPEVFASRVLWGDAVEGSARELLSEPEGGEDGDSPQAMERFIRSLLANGPILASEFRKDADGAGYHWRAIYRLAKKLGAEPRKEGMRGPWRWGFYDPPKMRSPHEGDEGDTTRSLSSSSSSADLVTPSWAPSPPVVTADDTEVV